MKDMCAGGFDALVFFNAARRGVTNDGSVMLSEPYPSCFDVGEYAVPKP